MFMRTVDKRDGESCILRFNRGAAYWRKLKDCVPMQSNESSHDYGLRCYDHYMKYCTGTKQT